ncbi:MAG: hypothetical protein ACLPVO_13900 [Desulfomonilaceae bacterium]
MEVIGVWFLFCAIFSAILARHKNRNTVRWFLAGLIFGPFGLLVVVFFPKIEYVFISRYNSNLLPK